MIALLLNPRVLSSLLILAALTASHWYAYGQGESAVQARWNAQTAAQKQALVEEATKDAQATVKVVTKYVDREKIIYRDRPVIRDRVVRLCEQSDTGAGLPASAGDSDALATRLTLDALIDEIPQCVSTANQLDALQQFIRERWQ